MHDGASQPTSLDEGHDGLASAPRPSKITTHTPCKVSATPADALMFVVAGGINLPTTLGFQPRIIGLVGFNQGCTGPHEVPSPMKCMPRRIRNDWP